MKLRLAVLAAFLAGGNAFQIVPNPESATNTARVANLLKSPLFASTSTPEDCGCSTGPEILSGDVPEVARSLNPRESLRNTNVYRVSGESVSVNELLDRGENKLSVLVLLRSLG